MREIKKVAVIGAGVMGPGIAQIMTLAGVRVCLYDIVPEALDRAKQALFSSYETFVSEEILQPGQVEPLFSRVTYATDLALAVEGADLVFEVVAEREEIKRSVYAQLDSLLPSDAIIASNTSALDIFELVPPRRLSHTVIAHWYAPANVIPLVEVVGHPQTMEDVVQAVMELLRRGGKRPVRMQKFIRGYIVNRLQQCLNQEVFYLLDNGYCTPEDIDVAVKSSFIPRACVLGLCKRMDFGGLDMTANNFRNHSYTMPPPTDMPKTLGEHVERGELGVKTGRGFYDYAGMDTEALKAKRDRQLFDVFRLVNAFMDDPV